MTVVEQPYVQKCHMFMYHETVIDVNALAEASVEALRGLGTEARITLQPASGDSGTDGTLHLRWKGGELWRVVQFKTNLRPSSLGPLLHRLAAQHPPVVLVTDHMSAAMAQAARDSGIGFLDSGGNAWLRDPETGLFIDVRGRPPTVVVTRSRTTFTRANLRVTLALLADPTLARAPMRTVQAVSGAALGSVQATLKLLGERGFIGEHGLRRGAQLLDVWTDAYLTHGGFHATERRFILPEGRDLRALLTQVGDGWLSGEFAGEALGWPIRGMTALVYTAAVPPFVVAGRLRREGPGLPVEFRTPSVAASDNQAPIGPSVLIRADMLASGDPRQIEIGEGALEGDENIRRIRAIG